jgi:hypothetical protein
MRAGGKRHTEADGRFSRFCKRTEVLSGAGTAARNTAGLTAPTVSYLIQTHHSETLP